eukprot:3425132-Ditylum_brightwellii.AAC.1
MPDTSYEEELLKNIEFMCKKLGRHMAINRKDELSDRNKEFLLGKDCEEMVVSAKMKLAAVTCQLWKHKEKSNQTHNNKLFEKTSKCFCESLRRSCDVMTDRLSQEEITQFWSNLFGKMAKHNDEAAWLQVQEKSVENVQERQWTNITVEEMCQTARKLTK